ncbi:MAG: hypothetical protein AAGA02_09310 [Bacteroidota bacterium]
MIHYSLLLCLLLLVNVCSGQQDYSHYYKTRIKAEQLIVDRRFNDALAEMEAMFESYEFVFLRDYKVAAQLAMLTRDRNKALNLVKKAIAKGWNPKSISKNKLLVTLTEDDRWESIKSNYSSDPKYLEINHKLRSQVHEMYKKDQKKAMGALLRVGNKAQEKYGNRKFAPHSEQQIAELNQILEQHGYPGERLIANNFWASTILSHHNSMSEEYVKQDTLFRFLKPKLKKAVKNGQMSPFEFALVSDWKMAVESNHGTTSYGFLGAIQGAPYTEKVNQNRAQIGLRSLELRNDLVDLEKELDLNFYLPGEPWQKGKIQAIE